MGSSRPQHWVLFVVDNRVSPVSWTSSGYITDRQIISALRNRAERSALIRRAQANREHRDLMAMPLPSGGGSR